MDVEIIRVVIVSKYLKKMRIGRFVRDLAYGKCENSNL